MYHVVWLVSGPLVTSDGKVLDKDKMVYTCIYKQKPSNLSKRFRGVDYQSAFNEFYKWFKENNYDWTDVEPDSSEELGGYIREGDTVYRLWKQKHIKATNYQQSSDNTDL